MADDQGGVPDCPPLGPMPKAQKTPRGAFPIRSARYTPTALWVPSRTLYGTLPAGEARPLSRHDGRRPDPNRKRTLRTSAMGGNRSLPLAGQGLIFPSR